MKFSDFSTYFKKIIVNFAPFKDIVLYKYFMAFLEKTYFKDLYSNVPSLFKLLYEEQTIPIEIYERILLSNGYPKRIIETLTQDQLEVLLSNFMDYNRSKGSVELMTRVASSSIEDISIYELYISNRDKQVNNWSFTPYLIYSDPDKEIITGDFNYDEIFYNTNKFFISQANLNPIIDDIMLPFKSNLLYIDTTKKHQLGDLNSYVNGMVLSAYSDNIVTLVMNNITFVLTFLELYQLYYYILLKKHPTIFKENYLTISYNRNNTYNSTTGIGIANFISRLSELESISDRLELSDFHNIYLKQPHIDNNVASNPNNNLTIDSTSVVSSVNASLNSSIIDFVDANYIEFDLLTDIKNAFVTWRVTSGLDPIIFDKFLETLSSESAYFKDTLQYKLFHFYKPYHVELIINDKSVISVKDKLTSGFTSHEFKFIIRHTEVTVPTVSYQHDHHDNPNLKARERMGIDTTDARPQDVILSIDEGAGDTHLSNIVNHVVVFPTNT